MLDLEANILEKIFAVKKTCWLLTLKALPSSELSQLFKANQDNYFYNFLADVQKGLVFVEGEYVSNLNYVFKWL